MSADLAHSLFTCLRKPIFRKCASFSFPDVMVTMGFARDEINDALINQKYDEVMATYILLGRKPPEVSFSPLSLCHLSHVSS